MNAIRIRVVAILVKYLPVVLFVHDSRLLLAEHLADKDYPEWYGHLHRDGTVAQPAKGNIFKGPFHVPRMMIRAAMLCDDILKG